MQEIQRVSLSASGTSSVGTSISGLGDEEETGETGEAEKRHGQRELYKYEVLV